MPAGSEMVKTGKPDRLSKSKTIFPRRWITSVRKKSNGPGIGEMRTFSIPGAAGRMPAMLANVVERTKLSIIAAHDSDGLTRYHVGPIGAAL